MNITIDDTSPQINYFFGGPNGSWDTDQSDDVDANQFYKGTFHSTYHDGDRMEVDFNGTAIYVYGSNRPNHGFYSSQLDQGNVQYTMGYSADSLFQQVIFQAGGLDPHQSHHLWIENLPSQTSPPGNDTLRWYLDIDYIIITSLGTGKIYTTTYDDGSPAFSYNGFEAFSSYGYGYYNNTNHLALNPSSSMSFAFNGSSVQLFGGINYDHGNYSVVLDGGLNQIYNGTSSQLFPQTSLFMASNLTDGPHAITVTSLGSHTGNSFDIDFAVVNSSLAPNLGSNSTNATTGSSDPGKESNNASLAPYLGSNSTNVTTGSSDPDQESNNGGGTNTGAIAGGVVAGVVGLAMIAFLVWFFVFRKKRQHGAKLHDAVDLAGPPNDSERLVGREIMPFPSSTRGDFGTTSPRSGPESRTGTEVDGTSTRQMSQTGGSGPHFLNIPPLPASNTTSFTLASDAGGNHSYDAYNNPAGFSQRSVEPTESGYSTGQSQSQIACPEPSQGTTTQHVRSVSSPRTSPPLPLKTPGIALSYTAQPPRPFPPAVGTPQLPPVSNLERRLKLAGREKDMGPVPHDDSEYGDEMLPPDYHQATQPLPGR